MKGCQVVDGKLQLITVFRYGKAVGYSAGVVNQRMQLPARFRLQVFLDLKAQSADMVLCRQVSQEEMQASSGIFLLDKPGRLLDIGFRPPHPDHQRAGFCKSCNSAQPDAGSGAGDNECHIVKVIRKVHAALAF